MLYTATTPVVMGLMKIDKKDLPALAVLPLYRILHLSPIYRSVDCDDLVSNHLREAGLRHVRAHVIGESSKKFINDDDIRP